MLNFVLVLRVYQLTSSNTAVSVLILSFMIPQLIVSLFAGVLVDRLEKKVVMLITNAVRALCLLALIFFGSQLIALYIFAFVVSATTQFFLPAEVAMIPQLVRKKLLLPANSLFTGTLYGSIIAGYVLAGPSLKFLGATTTFLILAIFFAGASFCNSLLPGRLKRDYLQEQISRFSRVTSARLIKVLFNDIGEVLYAIFRSPHVLLAILFLTISQTVIVVLGALLPGFTATIIATDVEDSSLIILAPAALGMVVGSFFVASVGRKLRKSRLVLPGVVLSGIMLFFLPVLSWFTFTSTLIAVVATCFLLGIFNAMIIIPANIVIQERSAPSIRGRIYGLFHGLSALAALVPVTIAGYFSDLFGVGRVLTFLGITIMLCGVLPLLRGREDI